MCFTTWQFVGGFARAGTETSNQLFRIGMAAAKACNLISKMIILHARLFIALYFNRNLIVAHSHSRKHLETFDANANELGKRASERDII
jgi:hypothetical protein